MVRGEVREQGEGSSVGGIRFCRNMGGGVDENFDFFILSEMGKIWKVLIRGVIYFGLCFKGVIVVMLRVDYKE